MKKISYILLLISAAVVLNCSEKNDSNINSKIIKDDLGNSVEISSAPKRIISLAPSLTEMFFDLGLEESLVGNTLYCNYPARAQRIEKIGDLLTFNFEKILQLKPDLIFITVEGNTKETYDKFRELGLKIFVSNPRNYNGIKKTYSDIGKIFGIEEITNRKISTWDSTISLISDLASENEPQTGIFLIELKPIMAAGERTYFNEFLEICGLENSAVGGSGNYPIFNREELLSRDPDYIFYPTSLNANLTETINSYPEWKQLSAVKNNRFFIVDRDLYSRPGPRFVEAIKNLFNLLHPAETETHSIQQ
jgi:iron complex transport system substrate-binding protein